MNLFSCLVPCGLHWASAGSEDCHSEDIRRPGGQGPVLSQYSRRRQEHNIGHRELDQQDSVGVRGCGFARVVRRAPPARMTGGATVVVMGASASTDSPSPPMGVVVRERKKKVNGFATLRKKFIRRRRSSKTCDHGRVLRELVSDWTPLEVGALLEEYEALAALKDLSVQAELARPPATTFKQDLCTLFEQKHCTDADLVFRGAIFPVHRALLSARCPYFRDLLAGCPGYGARICLELRTTTVDVAMFSALLRYLYTGDLCHDPSMDMTLLRRLGEEFGTPNPLENDLRYLLESGDYADAALVFTAETGDYHRPDSGSSEYGFRPKLELPCHKAILSARSPFFRNLIQRRTRNGEDHTERALHVATRIVLDESVIPKRYARVLLHAVYLDTVDLSLIIRGNGCGNSGSLGEALTHTGRVRPSALEEAMELYQIGRFLELDILAQGCEDLILDWLTPESLPGVLRWGAQPHGSAWVHRQALHFLREEFQPVALSTVLHQLDKTHLITVLQSHFLQASELEVLQAVLKWGEQELIRRMEDREPNILSHTAHSVARKGVKKRDLSDVELREILSELLPLVRMDHVLPPSSEILNQAIRRGLVSTPPSHMIGDDRENLRVNAWIRGGKNNGLFVRPRLFMPYYEEVKSLLEDQLLQEVELVRLRRGRYIPDIPDTLYMVSEPPRAMGAAGVDIVANALPVPDSQTMAAMLKREQKLRQSPSCQRAITLPLSSRYEINRQIRLRVVREFNLPDAVADLLENAACYYSQEAQDSEMPLRGHSQSNATPPPSPAKISSNTQSQSTGVGSHSSRHTINMTFPRQATCMQRHELPALVTEGEYRMPCEQESSSCSDGHLSDIMPDVAMATASFGQMQLQEQHSAHHSQLSLLSQQQQQQQHVHAQQQEALQLDLGDGPSHHIHTAGQVMAHRTGSYSGASHSLIQHNTLSGGSSNGYHRYLSGSTSPYSMHRHSPGPSQHYPTGPPRFL
ncbi:BTB/POZ domain-containing protein 7 isoform X2 [Ctenocephalides felis]|uniref:BTB/POZ domain-containing protein 7 isoform X2 n=1 Tax=Ctenocephalides felis TaxID=7515 RepID=UPI000E6E2B40|nr:BTB/POZ domain-containing protein 7 isoform X2 [Ctenocephalides felis]